MSGQPAWLASPNTEATPNSPNTRARTPERTSPRVRTRARRAMRNIYLPLTSYRHGNWNDRQEPYRAARSLGSILSTPGFSDTKRPCPSVTAHLRQIYYGAARAAPRHLLAIAAPDLLDRSARAPLTRVARVGTHRSRALCAAGLSLCEANSDKPGWSEIVKGPHGVLCCPRHSGSRDLWSVAS